MLGNFSAAPVIDIPHQRPCRSQMPPSGFTTKPAVRPDYLAFGQPHFSEEEIAAVTRVLRSGWVGMGPEVIAFEHELAEFIQIPHVVTVNSCTSALHLALLASGVGPGDEVIVPSLTWCSTANAALYLGAKPVLCDVDLATLCVTPATILSRLTPRTKAVVAVHFGGLAVDVAALRASLPAHITIIEDAAHALGSHYPDGRVVGASGNPVCFSFYANKNLSTGEGGAIAVADSTMANRLRSLRQHGLAVDAWKRFSHPHILPKAPPQELGFKMNYTDLQACLGRVQLRRQPEFHSCRLAVARIYANALAPLGIGLQSGCLDHRHSRHLFVIVLPIERMRLTRDEILLELRNRRIGASIHYAPLHRMPLYQHPPTVILSATDFAAERLLTLPIGARMTEADAVYVVEHCRQVLSY